MVFFNFNFFIDNTIAIEINIDEIIPNIIAIKRTSSDICLNIHDIVCDIIINNEIPKIIVKIIMFVCYLQSGIFILFIYDKY